MSNSRIVYQNWIVDLGHDTMEQLFDNSRIYNPDEHLREAVSLALKRLSTNEKEFIVQFYYMGKSYREIADQSGRVIYKLEAIHRRALKKLEAELRGFVSKRFNITDEKTHDCPVCNSEYSDEINEIIAKRNPQDTWRPIIKILKERYDLNIRSPQTLIGHSKYHTHSVTIREAHT